MPNNPEKLLSTLSQLAGQINITPDVLICALEPAFISSSNETGVETMAWDEFDTQGNDMMQRMYEDRMKKAQQIEAANQLPTMAPTRGPLGARASVLPPRGIAGGGTRGQLPELNLDSDDSDFGEQIKKKKRVNEGNKGQITRPSVAQRGIPIGGTLPPGMTILDLDSSDEDEFFAKNTKKSVNNGNGGKNGQFGRRSIQRGPQVISMSYKPDHSGPLSQSLMGNSNMAFMTSNDFELDVDIVEENEEDEDDETDDVKKKNFNQNNTQNNQNNQNKLLSTNSPRQVPMRPGQAKPDSSTPPPPPPPLDSPVSTIVRPNRPPGVPAATNRMSILDKARLGTGAVAGGAPITVTENIATPAPTAGRMSIWDKAKAGNGGAGAATTTTTTTTTTGIGPIAPAAGPNTTGQFGRFTIAPGMGNQGGAANPLTTTTNNVAPGKPAVGTTTTAAPTPVGSNDPSATPFQALVFTPQDIISPTLSDNTSSFLSQQLNDSGFLRNHQRTKDSRPMRFNGQQQQKQGLDNGTGTKGKILQAFPIRFKFNTSLMSVSVSPSISVEQFIQECLTQYKAANRTPALQSTQSKHYELYMWDDDEEEVDEDMPPFNRNQIISQLQSTAMCIVPDKSIKGNRLAMLDLEENTVLSTPRAGSASSSMFQGNGEDYYDDLGGFGDHFGPPNSTEILSPRNYGKSTYQHPDTSLDLHTTSIAETLLNTQISEESLSTLDSVSAYIHQLYGQLTPAIAGKSTQYKTFKINEKGKRQERYFGLDRYNIYNKTTPSSAFNTFSKLLNISKTERPIKSIIHVRVLPENLATFQIDYKEDNSDTITTRGYEVESIMICAEIVAKLRYLINHP